MRIKKLEYYFDLMDSDHDGLISADNISLDSLPTYVIEILGEVIGKLEHLGVKMDCESWIEQTL
jgi:hypothetical protein